MPAETETSIPRPVSVPNGGTGLTAGTSGGIPAYDSTTTMVSSGLLAASALMIGGGAGVAPSTTITGTGVLVGIIARPIFATTATAAGTTTLTVTSASTQEATGSTTQTYTMPVVTTLVAGWATTFVNLSTGNVTLNSSGGNAIVVLAGGQSATLVLKSISANTTAAAWDVVGLSPFTVVSPIGGLALRDEFLGGTTSAGNYGNLGWTILSFGGAATNTFVAGTLPNIGVLSYTSGIVSGNGGGIYLINSGVSNINNISGLIFEMWWTVKLTSVADVGCYLGFLNDTATGPKIDNAGSGCNNQGVWISFDTSLTTPDTQWMLRTSNASSGTGNVAAAAFTGSIVAGQYYTFKLRGDGTGVIYGTMYDNTGAIVGTEISVSGKTPTSTMVITGVQLTRTVAQKTISFDYFGLSAKLSR